MFCNMYDKSTNFLKISSIFGEYFLPDLKDFVSV